MDRVARLPAADRAALFTETAARAGISAVVVEKDFWVTWSLARLYALPRMPRLLFKGGTSLSKCFKIIERFSEDIDLGLHREDLGISPEDAPSPDKGSKRQARALDLLTQRAQEFVEHTFAPKLHEEFRSALGEPFELTVERVGKESVVGFAYPGSLPTTLYGPGRYIRPVVKMEIGARSDHYPTREVDIRSLAAEQFPAAFKVAATRVVAQAPERTLLEKALILHSDAARKKVGPRSSRHAYDLAMLVRANVFASLTRELYVDVAKHKRVFGEDRVAGEAPETGLRIIPDEETLRALEADYRNMEEMFYTSPPAFAEIVAALREIEGRINGLE